MQIDIRTEEDDDVQDHEQILLLATDLIKNDNSLMILVARCEHDHIEESWMNGYPVPFWGEIEGNEIFGWKYKFNGWAPLFNFFCL